MFPDVAGCRDRVLNDTQPLLQGPLMWMIQQNRGLGVQGAGMSVEEAGAMG